MKNITAAILVNPGKVAAYVNRILDILQNTEGISIRIIRDEESFLPLSLKENIFIEWQNMAPLAKLEPLKYDIHYSLDHEGNPVEDGKSDPDLIFDLVINLTSFTLEGSPLNKFPVMELSARQGASSGYYRGVAAALTEKQTVIPSFIYQPSQNNKLIWKEGWFKSTLHSYRVTLQTILDGTVHLLMDAVKQFRDHQLKPYPSVYPTLSSPVVDPVQAFPLLIRANIRHRLRNLFTVNKWNVGYVDMPIHGFINAGDKKIKVKWEKEDRGLNFKADPFGITSENKEIMIYEYFSARDKKGVLKTKDLSLKSGKDTELCSKDNHLSYPYTFKFNNEWYCIPEQSKSGRLEIFRIDTNKPELTPFNVISENFAAVDSSIIFYNNRWWLFCTDAANKGADLRLHIFYADDLKSTWQSHKLNPVKTDIRSARPGGTLFIHEGKLYRPAQDSSSQYGGEVVLMQVTVLNADEFAEEEINRINPLLFGSRYPEGTHTLSMLGNKTLIDGKRNVLSLQNLMRLFSNKNAKE